MHKFRWSKIRILLLFSLGLCTFSIAKQMKTFVEPSLDLPRTKNFAKVVRKSVTKTQKFLISEINTKGLIKSEPKETAQDFGLKSLIAYCGLLDSGIKIESDKLKFGIKHLLELEPKNLKVLSWQKLLCTKLNTKESSKVAKKCDKIILDCIKPNIQVSNKITSNPKASQCNNQITALAIRALLTGCTIELEQKFLIRVLEYWQSQQLKNGGFGFKFHIREGKPWTNPYGSITASILNSYILCLAKLIEENSSKFSSKNSLDKKAINWIVKNFRFRLNPNKNMQGYYDWIYQLNLLSDKTGLRRIGEISWYSKVANLLTKSQNYNGSFGFQKDIIKTSLALSVLAKKSRPIFITKLITSKVCDRYLPDAKFIADTVSKTFENPVSWQAVKIQNLNSQAAGRIIYIRGKDLIFLTNNELKLLKSYLLKGNLLVTNIITSDADKNEKLNIIFRKLFPQYHINKIKKDSTFYKIRKSNIALKNLSCINNGIRNLVIAFDDDISKTIFNTKAANHSKLINSINNLYAYISSNSKSFKIDIVNSKNSSHFIKSELKIFHINHRGNPNPEPAGFAQMKDFFINKKINFNYSKPISICKIPEKSIAYLTGTSNFSFSKTELDSFKKFLKSGGKIIANAAGSSKDFDKSFRAIISKFATLEKLEPKSNFLKEYPGLIRVKYRTIKSRKLRIYSIKLDGKIVGYYSSVDISAALAGYPLLGLKSYTPSYGRNLFYAFVKSLK